MGEASPVTMQQQNDDSENGTVLEPPSLPEGWLIFESKSEPGVYYYHNDVTGDSQWEVPTEPAANAADKQLPNMASTPTRDAPSSNATNNETLTADGKQQHGATVEHVTDADPNRELSEHDKLLSEVSNFNAMMGQFQ